MKKNNTTRKQLFVVIKKTRSFSKKTEINTQSRQNTSEASNAASNYSTSPSTGLDNIRLSAPESARPSSAPTTASQPTPPLPVTTVPPLPKFSPPQTLMPPVEAPTQPAATNATPPSQPTPASTAAAPTIEPAAQQEPATPPFTPDYAAAGSQLSKLMSGMAAPLSRLAGSVPGLLSSASKSITQAAKANSSVATSKPASVESRATAPEVNAAETKPIEVKPIEVDVKVNTVAPVSPSAASTVASTSLSNGSTASKPLTTVTWNPATTISSLQRNAAKKSKGYCAKAVVNAIQAGGTKIERTPAAKDLGAKLIAAGFKSIFSMSRPSREYDRSNLLPGDVVVLEGFNKDERKGIQKNHPYGHAAMYDGSKWISDFTQSGFYPGEDYRKALPGYTIYRMAATQAQINAINASQSVEPTPQTPVVAPAMPVTRPMTQATLSSTSAPAVRPARPAARQSMPVSHPAPQPARPAVTTSHTEVNESLPAASIGNNTQPESTGDTSAQGANRHIPTVLKGKVTYDAEGSEERGKYFSRHLHFPETDESGVTLGRGYDMGKRTKEQVYNDLIAAGIPASQASKISSAAGKTGERAKRFINQNKDIGEISIEQQIKLFNNTYPIYEKRAQDLYKKNTSKTSNVTKWENLNPAIKDILVDIVYQGFQGVEAMPAASKNDLDQFITFLKNNKSYQKYEKGRHRVAYLQKEKNRISRNQNN